MFGLNLMQADQEARLKHARLHHQHQRGASRDGADRRLLRIEKRHRLLQRRRLHHVERNHSCPLTTLSCPAKSGHPVIAERTASAPSSKTATMPITGSSAIA